MSAAETNAPANRATSLRENAEREIARIAGALLVQLVGPERAKEAQARLLLSIRQAAMAAPKLYEATPAAIANGVALSALTGLMPGGIYADAWLIPKGGSAGGMLWMPSHRGVIKLARRAGYEVEPVLVFEGEHFAMRRSPFVELEHSPDDTVEQSWATLRGAYLLYWPIGNRAEWRVYWLDKEGLDARRKASDNASGTTWTTWWREMAVKTLVKAAAGRGVLPLDDVGIAAIVAEDQREVIDVTPQPAATQRAIPDHRTSTLDGLEETLGAEERAEPVPAQPKRESKREPKSKAQAAPQIDRAAVLRDAKSLADAAGGEYTNGVRAELGIPLTVPIDGLTDADLVRLRNALEERIGGGGE